MLVLASASVPRRELLAQIGIVPDAVRPMEIDESPRADETPSALALRLSRAKANACAISLCALTPAEPHLVPRAGAPVWILGADTVVACGRRILGTPSSAGEALACLRLLSGRRHRVCSAVAVVRLELRDGVPVCAAEAARVAHAVVRFRRIEHAEAQAHTRAEHWRARAGGYAAQGAAAAFIPWIRGAPGVVVGLPLVETVALLHGLGRRV